jgi:hypothetical protein
MRAGFEQVGFGGGIVGVALEKMTEKRKFDFVAIKISGLRMEIDVAELVAILAAPISMRPRAHNQQVGNAGILPLGPTISLERAEQILGVIPTADGHHGTMHVLEMWSNVARLPECIVCGMPEKLCPGRRTAFKRSESEFPSGPIRKKKS